MGCLQAQYAPSMYVGLWSRVDGFRREDLTRALEEGEVVQGTLMRVTIHLVSRADYWPLALAVRDARRALWLRTARHDVSAEWLPGVGGGAAGRTSATARSARTDLDGAGRARTGRSASGCGWTCVRALPSGTWERRRADLYAVAEARLGPPPADVTVEAATEHLVRRYLRGFGPATAADAAGWGGLRTADVQAVLERLDLRRFSTDDGVALYDLPGAPIPGAATPAPVRFLPTWDASLLVHARAQGRHRRAPTGPWCSTPGRRTRSADLPRRRDGGGHLAGTTRGRCGWRRSSRWPPACSRRSRPRPARLAAFHA
ncbi:MAG: winged helix DNA-binding domain-containing protein [Hymenobacter sp.]